MNKLQKMTETPSIKKLRKNPELIMYLYQLKKNSHMLLNIWKKKIKHRWKSQSIAFITYGIPQVRVLGPTLFLRSLNLKIKTLLSNTIILLLILLFYVIIWNKNL